MPFSQEDRRKTSDLFSRAFEERTLQDCQELWFSRSLQRGWKPPLPTVVLWPVWGKTMEKQPHGWGIDSSLLWQKAWRKLALLWLSVLGDTVHHGREGGAVRVRDWKVGYTTLAAKKHRMNRRWSQAVKLSGYPQRPTSCSKAPSLGRLHNLPK